jgi:glutamate-1-semialdehyde 2,1-aminomutase
MAAGLAQLEVLDRLDPFATLEARTASLVTGILEEAGNRGIEACGTAIGSMWGVFLTKGPVADFDDARATDTALFARYYRGCLNGGVFFAPSAFEAGFMSTAHTDADIEETVSAVGQALDMAVNVGFTEDG